MSDHKKNGVNVKARQYWAAKYKGHNGDLIVGRVRSVRTTGEVILINLLSGKKATKDIEVLKKRNAPIPKKDADALVRLYEKTGDRTATKRKANELTAHTRKKTLKAAPKTKNKVKDLQKRISAMTEELNKISAELRSLKANK